MGLNQIAWNLLSARVSSVPPRNAGKLLGAGRGELVLHAVGVHAERVTVHDRVELSDVDRPGGVVLRQGTGLPSFVGRAASSSVRR